MAARFLMPTKAEAMHEALQRMLAPPTRTDNTSWQTKLLHTLRQQWPVHVFDLQILTNKGKHSEWIWQTALLPESTDLQRHSTILGSSGAT